MKRKNKSPFCFGSLYSPYMTDESTNMAAWYQAYQNDPNRQIVIQGVVYHKVIFRQPIHGENGHVFIVGLHTTDMLTLQDQLVDENGNEFVVTGFELLRFTEIPEWYLKFFPIRIRGNTNQIGTYLARKPNLK